MSIHYAKIDTSPRLQRLLQCLESQPKESGGWVTTRSIINQADICAVNSAISELRRNGYEIESRKSREHGSAWEYRLWHMAGDQAVMPI